jgi:serine protease Do
MHMSLVRYPLSLRLVRTTLLPSLLALLLPNQAFSQEPPALPGSRLAQELSEAFENVAETITPSVVTISTETKPKKGKTPKGADALKDFFGEDFMDKMVPTPQRGLGTGVIVDEQGHILTNNHVIGEADEVNVRLTSEKSVKAKVVGVDPRTDLAVIKIKVKESLPKVAKLGDSDKLKIGEWVVAAGASFGLDNTITAGIVSAKGRAISGGGQYEDFIQTDAAINPGNSGGPLVNLRGEVVGINTAIVSKSGGYMGIGFAIPINMAKQVMDSLITKGKVTRGWLGVGIQNLSEDLSESFAYQGTEGALVGFVDPKGPAKTAGFKQGDIIVQLGKEKIKNVNQLRNSVAAIKPGTHVDVALFRKGKKLSLSVEIGELAAQTEEPIASPTGENEALGLTLEEFDESDAPKLKTTRSKGLVITEVDPQGLATRADLQPGDILVSINDTEVNTLSEFKAAMEKTDLKRGLRLIVESRGMERFAILKDSAVEDEDDAKDNSSSEEKDNGSSEEED